jgi:hypothetical protein
MEKEKKTVTVEIPEGKKAVWNEQGVLQLVDDEPKEVTERIKTFYDAQCELAQWAERGDCEAKQLIEEYNSVQTEGTSDDIVAYLQLRIITCALNEGWTPQFTENERRWYPYFCLWTEDELKDKSDEWKDVHQLLRWGGSASSGLNCGVACSYSYFEWSSTYAYIGSRLAYKTEALATFAGLTFAPVYARFFLGDKAKGLKPWREVEGKEEPEDEEEES